MMDKNLRWEEFERVEMRVGTVAEAAVSERAKKPALKLLIDFGAEIGKLRTSAQITRRYNPDELPGRQVIAVVNFPPKQVASVMSECLILGAVGDENDIVLLSPDFPVENGLRVG